MSADKSLSNDQMHRFMFDHTDIRGEVVSLNDSYGEVLDHNQHPPIVQQLLGEFLAAVTLLSSTLKFDGILTLQARGDGPLPLIMAECSHHKGLRAIARPNPDADFDRLETDARGNGKLREMLGKGVLAITIDPAFSANSRGERYQGIVPLDADNLAACLEHYFEQSEQLKTRFWLAADDRASSGLMLQALPRQINASEKENLDHWETTVTLADTVEPEELLTLAHETLLYRLFHEEQVRLFDSVGVRFACSCSRERTARVLQSMGQEEVNQLLVEQQSITIDCQFCNQTYLFGPQDVTELFSDQPQVLH